MMTEPGELCANFAPKRAALPPHRRWPRRLHAHWPTCPLAKPIERERGVALSETAELPETAERGGKLESFAVLGYKDGSVRQQRGFFEAAQNGLIVPFARVGRIKKDEVKRSTAFGLQCGNGARSVHGEEPRTLLDSEQR